MGVLRTREKLDKDLDDLKSQLPEQRKITRNIERILEQNNGGVGGAAVVMTNDVSRNVNQYINSQKTIMQYGSGLIKDIIQSWR